MQEVAICRKGQALRERWDNLDSFPRRTFSRKRNIDAPEWDAPCKTMKNQENKMKKTEGICKYCKKSFAGNAIARHLSSCRDKIDANLQDGGDEKIFLISAKAGPFWVYFEANASDKLKQIDSFLRKLWLECCGHLSAFNIGNNYYNSDGDIDLDPIPGKGSKSMNIVIGAVLSPGLAFSHEYDFGTTTKLDLKCISERTGNKLKQTEILARNNLPDFKCVCGKPAKEICTECLWEKGPEALLCKGCAKSHECGDEMFLPVVNSPRMGMCGYTG